MELQTKDVKGYMMVLYQNAAFHRSTVLSQLSFDRSLVLPMAVEKLEWKKPIVQTHVIYMHNNFKTGVSVIH